MKILLVEDNAGDARLIREMLKDAAAAEQFEVVHAERLQDGLARLSEGALDVALLDLGLPDSQGIETLIRMRETAPMLPIVVLTGLDDEETGRQAVGAGAQDYLIKGEVDGALLVRSLVYAVERSHADQALRASQRTLATLMSNLSGMVYRCCLDDHRTMEFVSEGGRLLTGYRPDALLHNKEIDYNTIIHPDDRQMVQEAVTTSVAQGAPFELTYRIVTADGAEKWVWERGRAVVLPDGRQVTEGFITDVTERVQAEGTRLYLASIVESSNDAIIGKTLDGTIVSWNTGAEEIYGYSAEEAEGRSVAILFPPDRQDELPQILESVRRGERITNFETKRTRKDGTVIDVSLTVSPIRDAGGNLIGASTTARDTTELKRAGEALREERDFAEGLVDTAQVIILTLDVEGRIVQFNRYMEQISGYCLEEVQGKEWFSTFLPERDRDRIRELFLQAIDDIQTVGNINPIVTKDGHERAIEWYDKTLKDADGNTTGLLSVGLDVTERRQAEEALRESEEQYRTLFEDIPLGLYQSAPSGELLDVNPAFVEILGYPDRETLLSTRAANLYPDPTVRTTWEEVLEHADGLRDYVEHPLRRYDGEIIWIRGYTRVIRDADGHKVCYRGSLEDITKHKQAEEALEKRVIQLALLNDVAREVTANLDLESLLASSARLIQETYAYPHVAIYLLEEDGLTMRGRAGEYANRFPHGHRLKHGQGIVGWVAREGKMLCINDVTSDSRYYQPFPDMMIRSELGAPLTAGDQILGVLDVQSDALDAFDEIDIVVLNTLAGQLATAIQNARLFEQTQRHLESLTNLNHASQVIASSLELKEVLRQIVELAGSIVGSDYTSVILPGEKSEAVTGVEDFRGVAPISQRIRSGGTTSYVLDSGQPVVVDDISEDGTTSPPLRRPDGELIKANPALATAGIRSYAAVPIQAREGTLGVLYVHSREPRAFRGQLALLTTFANHAAATIQNARLFEQARRRAEELETLRQVTLQITTQLDLDHLLQGLIENVVRLLGVEAGGMYLHDPERDVLRWVVAVGDPGRIPLGSELKRGEGLSGKIWETGQPLVVDNYLEWEGLAPQYKESLREHGGARAIMGVPVHWGDRLLGVINASATDALQRTFTESDVHLLTLFADQAAVAIQNARLYQELEAYSQFLSQAVAERTAELRRVKERVEAILDNSPDVILLLEPGGNVQVANRAFYQTCGYENDEVFNRPLTDLCRSEQIQALRDAIREVAEHHEARRLEITACHKDGLPFDADIALAPIIEDDDLSGMVCSVRDISALKEVERMKDAFVSNVSHELRTPITSLKLNHRLLGMEPERQAVYAERLGREIDRLDGLIEALLRLSRLDQGRVELNITTVDLNALAAQYVHDREPLAGNTKQELLLEAEPDLPQVQADPELLGQVLSVLLTNALNYTPSGGRIVVSTHTQLKDDKIWAGFGVTDNGVGIDPDDMAHLFVRFFRGKVGRASGKPGTGLGLAIAGEIVEQHHGWIEVTSEGIAGKGAAFTVWLPVEEK
jgi:PAS domain S-box-containing protein